MTDYIEPSDVDIQAAPETVQEYISQLIQHVDQLETALQPFADFGEPLSNPFIKDGANVTDDMATNTIKWELGYVTIVRTVLARHFMQAHKTLRGLR